MERRRQQIAAVVAVMIKRPARNRQCGTFGRIPVRDTTISSTRDPVAAVGNSGNGMMNEPGLPALSYGNNPTPVPDFPA